MSVQVEETKLVPRLRFPGFTSEWERKRLGHFTTFQRGFDLPTQERVPGNIPIVSSGGISGYHNVAKVTRPGIVTGRYGSIGELFLLQQPHWPLNTSLWVKDFHGNLLEFCYYQLKRVDFAKLSDKTGVPGINRNDLHKIWVATPSLPEQKKIADFLGAVDDKIAKLTEKKALLERYKKGMMQKLFSQSLRFKDENGQDYPDWEVKELGGFSKIFDGTHQTPKYVANGVPFYSVEHLTSNNFEKTKFISEVVFEKECKRARIEADDILMTRIGDIGTTKLMGENVRASFYVSLALIKLNNCVCSRYVEQFMRTDYFQRELWKRTIHVAFPKKINLGEISPCKLLLPSLSEQREIADFLTAIDDKINNVSDELEQAKLFKKGLLQQMFV